MKKYIIIGCNAADEILCGAIVHERNHNFAFSAGIVLVRDYPGAAMLIFRVYLWEHFLTTDLFTKK